MATHLHPIAQEASAKDDEAQLAILPPDTSPVSGSVSGAVNPESAPSKKKTKVYSKGHKKLLKDVVKVYSPSATVWNHPLSLQNLEDYHWIHWDGSKPDVELVDSVCPPNHYGVNRHGGGVKLPLPPSWLSMIYPTFLLCPPIQNVGKAPSSQQSGKSSHDAAGGGTFGDYKMVQRPTTRIFDQHTPPYLELHEIRHLPRSTVEDVVRRFRALADTFSGLGDFNIFNPDDVNGTIEKLSWGDKFSTPHDVFLETFKVKLQGEVDLQALVKHTLDSALSVVNRIVAFAARYDPEVPEIPFKFPCPPIVQLNHLTQGNKGAQTTSVPYREMFEGNVTPDLRWQLSLDFPSLTCLVLSEKQKHHFPHYLPRKMTQHPNLSVLGTIDVKPPNTNLSSIERLLKGGWTIQLESKRKPPGSNVRMVLKHDFDHGDCVDPEGFHKTVREADTAVLQSGRLKSHSATLHADREEAVKDRTSSTTVPLAWKVVAIEGLANWRLPSMASATTGAPSGSSTTEQSTDSELSARLRSGNGDFNPRLLQRLEDLVGTPDKIPLDNALKDDSPKKESIELAQQIWSQMVSQGTVLAISTNYWDDFRLLLRLPQQRTCLISDNFIDLFHSLLDMNTPNGDVVRCAKLSAFLYEKRKDVPSEAYDADGHKSTHPIASLLELFCAVILESLHLHVLFLGEEPSEDNPLHQLFERTDIPKDTWAETLESIPIDVTHRAEQQQRDQVELLELYLQHVKNGELGNDGGRAEGSRGRDESKGRDDDPSHETTGDEDGQEGRGREGGGRVGSSTKAGLNTRGQAGGGGNTECQEVLSSVASRTALFEGMDLTFHCERPCLESIGPSLFVPVPLPGLGQGGRTRSTSYTIPPSLSNNTDPGMRSSDSSSFAGSDSSSSDKGPSSSTSSDISLSRSSWTTVSSGSLSSINTSPILGRKDVGHLSNVGKPFEWQASTTRDKRSWEETTRYNGRGQALVGALHLDGRVLVAQGKIGQVWVAVACLDGGVDAGCELVAVKLAFGDEGTARLKHEAQVYEHLRHANTKASLKIPSYYGLFKAVDEDHESTYALVMSLEVGRPGNDFGPYESKLRAAVQDLHDLNVCHCDITPDNVLVDDEGNITLIDFHLAKLTSSSTMQRYDLDAIDEYL